MRLQRLVQRLERQRPGLLRQLQTQARNALDILATRQWAARAALPQHMHAPRRRHAAGVHHTYGKPPSGAMRTLAAWTFLQSSVACSLGASPGCFRACDTQRACSPDPRPHHEGADDDDGLVVGRPEAQLDLRHDLRLARHLRAGRALRAGGTYLGHALAPTDAALHGQGWHEALRGNVHGSAKGEALYLWVKDEALALVGVGRQLPRCRHFEALHNGLRAENVFEIACEEDCGVLLHGEERIQSRQAGLIQDTVLPAPFWPTMRVSGL